MLPVAQLYTRDVPVLRPPEGSDLLQVLWCPFDHDQQMKPWPIPRVFWRTAAEVTDILAELPEPTTAADEHYVPEPCLLHPEQVTEYPNFLDLSKDLQEQVRTWCERQAANSDSGWPYTDNPTGFYWNDLSTAPGWKAGGWPDWGVTDPVPQSCPSCGARMDPLLTIASTEWNASRSWIPEEEQSDAVPGAYPDLSRPTMIQIADNCRLQLYACSASPDHPHTERVQ